MDLRLETVEGVSETHTSEIEDLQNAYTSLTERINTMEAQQNGMYMRDRERSIQLQTEINEFITPKSQ